MHERSLVVDAMVYLAAAVVLVPIAARLKLGSVLGYLLAGCLIGPFGLRLVTDVENILHFSELGVVLMLFVIGLELEPKRLMQMGLCGLVLSVGALALGLGWRASLVAGLALALSSTAIAVQTLRERGALAGPMGRAAFGILLFQDIAAIPLVGIVPALADEGGAMSGGARALAIGKVVGAIVVVVALGRFALPPLLRIIAKTHLREVFTASALLLVLGIAQVMQLAGVSMALGAFLAGVLLASSEYRHALETDIEPFKGLLMGLFFIAVGMSIDFGLLAARPVFVLMLLLGFSALKLLALLAIGRRVGVPDGDRMAFAAVLSQGGEFAFVVFGVARAARVLPGEWDKLLTLTVALSMALTPLLLIAADRLARRGVKEREDDVIESDDAPVIIAGFGRFGQIVGRLLFASGLRATVLDHDPDQIELLKRFGFRIFYGDATRTDLLESAGAERAKVLVVAIDDMASALRLVDHARAHFPHLHIVARARNVQHFYELRSRGVTAIDRELFESALSSGRRVLEMLGVRPHEARERAERFKRHNLEMIESLRPENLPVDQRPAFARAARDQLEQQFKRDLEELADSHGEAWQGTDQSTRS
jgi:glutathione-regulated potassium-efflux system ancillary protein KefC